MNLTEAEDNRIKDLLPLQRGNVRVDNLTFLNAILYVLENGCKWRALPKEFGQWSTIYKRFRRWSENGVLNRVFIALNERAPKRRRRRPFRLWTRPVSKRVQMLLAL